MQNGLAVPFKAKSQRSAPITYVIPGFAETWRERFAPSQFRSMGVSDPQQMERMMRISEQMLADLPGKLAQLMNENRLSAAEGGEMEALMRNFEQVTDAAMPQEEGEGESESESEDISNTPFLPWNQETQSVLDALLDDYQLESLVDRTPLTPALVADHSYFEETCKPPSSSLRNGFIPCMAQRSEVPHRPCVSV